MKIAFLTPEFPHPKLKFSGGIGTSIFNLSKGLLQSGNEVVIVLYGHDKDEIFTENGITFYLIKNIKIKGFSKLLTQKKIEKLLNTLVDEDKIDVVEAVDWEGITSKIKPKCPLIVRLHGSDTYFSHLDNRRVKFLNRFNERRAIKNADALISVSQYTADLTNTLFGLQRHFTIIPNGIDINKFQVSNTNASNQELNILYFGTLIRKKGSLELPNIFNEVFKQNKRAKLILVGKDSSDLKSGNPSVWEMIKPLFDLDAIRNVEYVGSVSYDSIKDYINLATVCVFPTFAEALPVSWIEAMAMSKSIVASNIGWAPEVIDDGLNGFLVHPGNHKEYAAKIVKLLENIDLRNQFGLAAREKVEQQFSIEVVATQSLAFYKNCIQK